MFISKEGIRGVEVAADWRREVDEIVGWGTELGIDMGAFSKFSHLVRGRLVHVDTFDHKKTNLVAGGEVAVLSEESTLVSLEVNDYTILAGMVLVRGSFEEQLELPIVRVEKVFRGERVWPLRLEVSLIGELGGRVRETKLHVDGGRGGVSLSLARAIGDDGVVTGYAKIENERMDIKVDEQIFGLGQPKKEFEKLAWKYGVREEMPMSLTTEVAVALGNGIVSGDKRLIDFGAKGKESWLRLFNVLKEMSAWEGVIIG